MYRYHNSNYSYSTMLPERLDVGYISEFVIEESKISLDDTTTAVDVR